MILVVSSFDRMIESSCSATADSENIGILNLHNFGNKAINLCSILERFMLLVIAAKNPVVITPSSCLNCSTTFSIVRIIGEGLCLNSVMEHEYAA